MTKAASRKAAQRAIRSDACHVCGRQGQVQRHHEDYNHPLRVSVVCQDCHTRIHMAEGTWGRCKRRTA